MNVLMNTMCAGMFGRSFCISFGKCSFLLWVLAASVLTGCIVLPPSKFKDGGSRAPPLSHCILCVPFAFLAGLLAVARGCSFSCLAATHAQAAGVVTFFL